MMVFFFLYRLWNRTANKMFTVLENTAYRHLFLAQFIVLIGTSLITIALALLVYDMAREKATQVLGIILAIKMIAYIAVASVASVALAFAERLPRKKFWLCGLYNFHFLKIILFCYR